MQILCYDKGKTQVIAVVYGGLGVRASARTQDRVRAAVATARLALALAVALAAAAVTREARRRGGS